MVSFWLVARARALDVRQKMTKLRWIDGGMPPIPDCLRLLRAAFPVVVADEKRGLRYAAEKFLVARREGRADEAACLESTMSDAVEVVVALAPHTDSAFLKLMLVPGMPADVIISDSAADGQVMSIAARCADALSAELLVQ